MRGGVAEWPKVRHWKCRVGATLPWVRIPPPPPLIWLRVVRVPWEYLTGAGSALRSRDGRFEGGCTVIIGSEGERASLLPRTPPRLLIGCVARGAAPPPYSPPPGRADLAEEFAL